jgi:hypothetical protein
MAASMNRDIMPDVTDTVPTPEQISAMTPTARRVYLNRLRRMAARQGLTLRSSRVRDPRALGFGSVTLTDQRGKTVTTGQLGEIHRYLMHG